jgi:O-antigen/teichoic acid export membrane protein
MFRSSIEALILRVLGIVIWLAVTILFARILPQEEVGAVFYLVNIAILGGTIATLGYDITVLRYGSKMWRDGDGFGLIRIFGGGQTMALTAGAILAVVLFMVMISGYETPVTSSPTLVVLVVLSVTLSAMLGISRDLLRSVDRLRLALLGETVVRTLGFACFSVFLMLMGIRSATSFFGGYILALFLANAVQHSAVRTTIGAAKLSLPQPEHIKTALGAWFGRSSGILMMRLPGIVVGIKAGLLEAALFFAVDRIAQMTNLFVTAIRTATGPSLARASEGDLPEEVARASALMFLAGLLGGTGVIVLGTLVLLALGSSYFSAFPTLIFLLLGNLAVSVMGPCPLILYMRGRERIAAFVESTSIIVMGCTMIFILPVENALEISQIFAVAMWGMYICFWIVTRRVLGVTAGVFSVRGRHLLEMSQELRQMWDKFKSKLS